MGYFSKGPFADHLREIIFNWIQQFSSMHRFRLTNTFSVKL